MSLFPNRFTSWEFSHVPMFLKDQKRVLKCSSSHPCECVVLPTVVLSTYLGLTGVAAVVAA